MFYTSSSGYWWRSICSAAGNLFVLISGSENIKKSLVLQEITNHEDNERHSIMLMQQFSEKSDLLISPYPKCSRPRQPGHLSCSCTFCCFSFTFFIIWLSVHLSSILPSYPAPVLSWFLRLSRNGPNKPLFCPNICPSLSSVSVIVHFSHHGSGSYRICRALWSWAWNICLNRKEPSYSLWIQFGHRFANICWTGSHFLFRFLLPVSKL